MRVESVPRIFSAATAVLAVIPGLSAIFETLGTPPGRESLYGTLLMAQGIVVVLVMMAFEATAMRFGKSAIVSASCFFFVLACIGAMAYLSIVHGVVLTYEREPVNGGALVRSSVFIPLFLGDSLRSATLEVGGRVAFLNRYGVQAVEDMLRERGMSFFLTDLALIGILTTTQASYILAMMLPTALLRRRYGFTQKSIGVVPSAGHIES